MGWAQLSADLSVAHQQFVAVAEQLSSNLRSTYGVCGDWSPKQVIAHLIGWDTEAARGLTLFADGEEEQFIPVTDVNAFNASSVQTREQLSWDTVMSDLAQAHSELQSTIEILQEKNRKSDSGFGRWLIGRKQDYDLHRQQLEQWLINNDAPRN